MTEVERIFHEALEWPEVERDVFVAEACGPDAGLASDVLSLLRHHRQATSPLTAAVQPEASDLLAAAATACELPPGAMLGHYRIERKVGEGGMGTVYAAVDTRLGRQVALKLLRRAGTGGGDAARERFHREARLAAALSHPGIAVLHDFGESDGTPWLVMEFVTGAPLRSRLGFGPLSVVTVLRYATQLARALEHAHSRGIIHHDIKPENILVAEDGHLKVIDFGIASLVDDEAGESGRGALGTPAYAAPEVAASREAVSEASDIYSFGVVVYEMACGVLPFVQPGGAYMRAGDRNPALPAALAALIDRCLAPDPAGRFRNGAKLAAALGVVSAGASAAATGEARELMAILDFKRIAGDADLEWLGAGIAEVLASRLGKLRSVRIVNRAEMQRAAAAGQELDARWVVTGSYQRIAGQVRVTVRLEEPPAGELLLNETIDGSWTELFDIQDRAAVLLIQALAIRQQASDAQSQLTPDTRNLMAFEHYIRGRQESYRMEAGAVAAAIDHFEQAVALEPNYALAYSALGRACMLQFARTSNPEDVRRATACLERAIVLDPELGEPYPWLANIRMRRNDPAGAYAAGKKGVQLQPDLAEAHYFFGGPHYMGAECRFGDLSEGAAALAVAIRLQPKFHAAWLLLGASAAWAGRHETAVRILTEAARMESEPGLQYRFVGARALRATAWMRAGDWARARAGFEESLQSLGAEREHIYLECFRALSACGLGDVALRTGDGSGALSHYRQAWRIVKESPRIVGQQRLLIRVGAGLAGAYAATGDRGRARELVEDAAGQVTEAARNISTVTFESGLAQLHLSIAVALVRLEDLPAAALHLGRARESAWRDLGWLRTDPELRPLHGHPAYDAMITELSASPPVDIPVPSLVGEG